jgi:CBS domain-containing protein
MKVRDIMTKNVETVPETASLTEAAQLMKKLNVGVIPIVNGTKVVGLLTDRDIVLRSTAMGHDPNEVTVSDVMSKSLEYVYQDQDIKEAAKIMADKQIRRLPVLDRQMQMVGIISLGDLSVDADNEKRAGETLEDISKPAHPER